MFWLQMNLQQPAINAMVSEVIELLLRHYGVFHVVAKIIRELKSQMITYKFKCSHWLKLKHSDWRAILHQ